MAKLTASKRAAIPPSKFALPGGDKASGGKPAFPLVDKSHAQAAISGATRSANAGNISEATAKSIQSKSRAVLGKQPAPPAKPAPRKAKR